MFKPVSAAKRRTPPSGRAGKSEETIQLCSLGVLALEAYPTTLPPPRKKHEDAEKNKKVRTVVVRDKNKQTGAFTSTLTNQLVL